MVVQVGEVEDQEGRGSGFIGRNNEFYDFRGVVNLPVDRNLLLLEPSVDCIDSLLLESKKGDCSIKSGDLQNTAVPAGQFQVWKDFEGEKNDTIERIASFDPIAVEKPAHGVDTNHVAIVDSPSFFLIVNCMNVHEGFCSFRDPYPVIFILPICAEGYHL